MTPDTEHNFLKTHEEINSWLLEYTNLSRHEFMIEEDFEINTSTDVIIKNQGNGKNAEKIKFSYLPVQFNQVKGNFVVVHHALISLKGVPKIVKGNFSCNNNNLTSLKYAPKKVEGNFDCGKNKLTNLKYLPCEIGGNIFCYHNNIKTLKYLPEEIDAILDCSHNHLKSLKYAPKIVKEFNCSFNQLKTLKDTPHTVNGNFNCAGNQLTTLKFSPSKVLGDYNCSLNNLVSLEYLTNDIKDLLCRHNQITSLKGIKKAEKIICVDNPFTQILKDDLNELKVRDTLIFSNELDLQKYLNGLAIPYETTSLGNLSLSLKSLQEAFLIHNEMTLLESSLDRSFEKVENNTIKRLKI